MQFVHPEVLWALSALTIPVLVHLFSFRRHRKVAFSQTAFLKEVRMESRSRHRIRHWLVLLMRLLAMACIILAFAEPLRNAEEGQGNGGTQAISIYMDTSPSMELEGRNGPMIDAARNGALALVESRAASDRFHVVTSSFEPGDRRWLTKEEALERISRVVPGHGAPRIQDVLLHQQEYLSTAGADDRTAYLFTDLQKSSHGMDDGGGALVDSSLAVRFVTQAAQPRTNVRIDSAWFDTPLRLTGRSEVLHVRIRHDAQRPVDDLPLNLHINGRKTAIGSFNIVPGLSTDTVLRFRHDESGPVHAVISTTDAPVTFDDALHIGYTVEDHVTVLLIQGRASTPAEQVALGRLFGDGTLHEVRFMEASALDYDILDRSDFIVLQGVEDPTDGLVAALLRNVESGKSLWMIPPAASAGPGWSELLSGLGGHGMGPWMESEDPVRLGVLHADHPLFEGVFARSPGRVDLPSVRGWYTRERSGSLERNLLSFADGRPFMTTGMRGAGRFHFCASPLASSWSNLAQHALLVPLALRMAETSRVSGLHQFEAGTETAVLLQGLDRNVLADLTLREAEAGSSRRVMVEYTPVPGGVEVKLPLREVAPGSYALESTVPLGAGKDSSSVLMTLGINPPRVESRLEVWDPEDLRQALITHGWRGADVLSTDVEDLIDEVETLEAGQPLWLSLIALALLFLFIEMVLLKPTRRRRAETEGQTH